MLHHSQNGGYVVHFLNPLIDRRRHLYGRVVPRERFRGNDSRLLNADLLMFHYQQCVQRYLRAFSAEM